ncbi:hypothetical protein BDP27DRAFT_1198413, partial [Rhodocollybia butyracea]
FSIDRLPTIEETADALRLPVLTQNGSSIPFASCLGERPVKIIVCFIRHFLCPLCQDYMYSIGQSIDPEALEMAGISLVIVGNGGWEMIQSYRRIFKLPYPIYTDPTAALHTALGMTMRTLDPGPKFHPSSVPEAFGSETYVQHASLASGISLVLRNAVKTHMPIWRYMGDKALLGGEFIFVKSAKDSGIKCVWAHRMRYTTAHEGIVNVVEEA